MAAEVQFPAMDLVIRDATPDDLDAVQRIYGFYVETSLATFEEIAPDRDEIVRRYEAILALGLPYLVAERVGEVAGYAYASLYRPRTGYRFTCENSIYIDDARRGHGIGRELMTELIARCTGLGYRQMVAVIGDSENAASIGLHAAFDFVHAGNLRDSGFKFGRWVDALFMTRPLGEGAENLPSIAAPTGRIPE